MLIKIISIILFVQINTQKVILYEKGPFVLFYSIFFYCFKAKTFTLYCKTYLKVANIIELLKRYN